MTSFRKLALAICLLPTGSVAVAQSGDPVDPAQLSPLDRMSMSYGTYVVEYMQGYDDLFPPELMLQLSGVTQQKAIALKCDGYDVDEERYNAVMASLLEPLLKPDGDSAGGENWITIPAMIALNAYHTWLGGHLAVAGYDQAAFCATGPQIRETLAEGDASKINIWKDAN